MWLASAVESGFRWCKPVDGVVLKFEFVIPLMGGIGLNLLSAVVIAYTERGGWGRLLVHATSVCISAAPFG